MGRVNIVGAGLSGLSAAIHLAKAGIPCNLISALPSERAQSVLAEGGINAALDTMGEHDTPAEHFADTMKGGVDLADPNAVAGLTEHAPEIVRWMFSLGTPFQMEEERLILRNFGGQKKKRTAYSKSSTGKVLMTALIDEARRWEDAGLIHRFSHHLAEDLTIEGEGEDRCCSGLVIRDAYTSRLLNCPGPVILCSGGMNGIFPGLTTGTVPNTGNLTALVFAKGVEFGNLEFIQYHPTTVGIPGKRMLISEAARGEGGRLFILRDGKPWYFMEEKYPELGNLMPRDVVSREMFFVSHRPDCEPQVYLDLTGLPAATWGKKLSDIIENRIPQSETDKELRSLFTLHKKVLLAAAPFDFESYLLYVEWEREPDKKFYVPRREVMHPVVQAMQDLIDDRLDLLTISMPPGTGKSTLGIFFLSWVMGRFPDSQSLASAHSGMLTRSFYDGVYQIITDSEYLWADVFPGVKMAATNSKEETIDLHKKHRFSTLTCRAINASLTGATRCDKILYADDLCSGIEEAMSKERLDKLWSAYTNDLKSRKKEGAKEIHIATRWSVHDVIGRLENQYGGDSRAKFIVLPALDADGESNFNYTYGVGFSRNYFEDMRNNLDEASFKALFMNQPIEREGLLYDVDELRRYFELPAEDPDAIIGICDTKDKGSDYAFLPAAYVYGNDYYIDDCVCDNSLPNIVDARLVDILLRCKVKMCRFESNSAGGRVAEKVQNEVKKRGGITRITTKFTTANKETKIIVNSAWVKEHCLFKDDSLYKRQSDYGRMMDMLGSYTVAGKNKHDDVPDGMAMLAEFAQSLSGARVEVFQRPW